MTPTLSTFDIALSTPSFYLTTILSGFCEESRDIDTFWFGMQVAA
jgi:hypothetical protein